jgi:hypothetical protein
MDKTDRLHGGASSKQSRRLSHDLSIDARRLDQLIAARRQDRKRSVPKNAAHVIDVAAARSKARHHLDK